MATIKNSCPYRVVRKVARPAVITVEERIDFQIGESGKVDRVSLGLFDLIQEVESHKGEVGLVNCLKLAQARGLDPTTAFAKTEDGLMADPGDINTLDDLLKAKASADAKFAAIAKEYGISTEKLLEIIRTGKIDELEKPVESEGGSDNA